MQACRHQTVVTVHIAGLLSVSQSRVATCHSLVDGPEPPLPDLVEGTEVCRGPLQLLQSEDTCPHTVGGAVGEGGGHGPHVAFIGCQVSPQDDFRRLQKFRA